MSFKERDFELPGGPINKTGILLRIHTKLVNKFSQIALLYAIFILGSFNLCMYSFCSLKTTF